MFVKLPKETIEKIVTYLYQRPYGEVVQLLQEITIEGRVVQELSANVEPEQEEEGVPANED